MEIIPQRETLLNTFHRPALRIVSPAKCLIEICSTVLPAIHYRREWGRNEKAELHKIIDEVIKQRGYKGNYRLLLREIFKRSDPNFQSHASQETLAQSINASDRTIRRILAVYQENGDISYGKVGWGNDTKIITLLCLRHWKPVKQVTMTDNINNLNNLRNNNNTYSKQPVSIFCNSPEKKPKPKFKPPSKYVDKAKLNGTVEEAELEVTRICQANGLSEEETAYAKRRMRDRGGMNDPASFLARMARGLANKTWNMVETPTMQAREVSVRRSREVNEIMAERRLKDDEPRASQEAVKDYVAQMRKFLRGG